MNHLTNPLTRQDVFLKIARLEQRFSGRLAVAATNLSSGEQIVVNGDDIFPTASVIKVPVLIEVFRMAKAGLLSLDERLTVTSSEHAGGSGVLNDLDGGLQLTIKDLATLMIAVSDNTATNMLIARVGGPDAVNKTMRAMGFQSVVLHAAYAQEAFAKDPRAFGEASPNALESIIVHLARGQIVDAESSRVMLEIMSRQHYLDQAPRYLRVRPFATDEMARHYPVRVASKTGFSQHGLRVDLGLISLAPGTEIAYCVAADQSQDHSFAPENEGACLQRAHRSTSCRILVVGSKRSGAATQHTAPCPHIGGLSVRNIAGTDLQVFELCLGGNAFGWTAEKAEAELVLDAYVAAGGNFIDTADQYVSWVKNTSGGESEQIIGTWMADRGNRERLVIATKVGKAPGLTGLSARTIRRAAEGSLTRLQTDYLDLYYAHADDPEVPLEEALAAFDRLVREGKVRYVAASNYSASRLAAALEVSNREGFSRFVALQPHYNLMHRTEYEGALAELCSREHLSCVPHSALASGFLTGKYKSNNQSSRESPRAERARAYVDQRGSDVLDALERIASRHDTTIPAVALAWLAGQDTVTAPIASVRSPQQLKQLLEFTALSLDAAELRRLSDTSSEQRAAHTLS